MAIFTGSAVAIITPFLAEGGINFDTFGKLIEFQIENGTDAIVVCGTTGEPPTMTTDEKRSAIAFCVKQAAGRVPVIAGTGGNCTANVIADSKAAEELGANALLIVTPYYNKCTQAGLVAHFHAVADEVQIPIVVYNVPSRTGVNILPATMAQIAAHPNIAALKEAAGDVSQMAEMARLCPDLDLYSGNDDQILPILAYGGKGVISVLANCAPKLTHELCAAYFDGDIAKCRALQLQVNPLVAALFCEVNPIPVKTSVALLGFEVGEVRLPLTPLSPNGRTRLEGEMRALGLIQ